MIAHLKQLAQTHPGLIVELYAEVKFANKTNRVKVQRTTEWPVEIGLTKKYEDLPADYN